MTVQTSYPFDRAVGYPGQPAESGPHRTKTVLAAVAIAAGLLVLRGETRAKGYLPTTPDAADADAIIATGASAATAQTISGGSLDGAIGGDEMLQPRNLTLTLSNHANWDATTAVVTGEDEEGQVIQESFLIPDGGNATVTGVKHFAKVTSLYIPAQAGASGTFTLGTGSKLGPITGRYVHGVAMYDASREPEAYPANYAVPVIERGPVYVTSETAYEDGDAVYVRFIAVDGETAGVFRNTPDANDCALVKGARFRRTGSAGVAVIDLNLS